MLLSCEHVCFFDCSYFPFFFIVSSSQSIETGAYIATGTTALTLADDQLLEIQVPLGDKEVFEILGLRETDPDSTWFSDLDKIACHVETVTGSVSAHVPAVIDRAVKYDPDSRTLSLAVRVDANARTSDHAAIPVVDGMFCRVFFKGKSVPDVVKMPVAALNADNTIYLARNNRLKTLTVTQIMADGDEVYISGNFEPRDQIIITPLSQPIENTLLDVSSHRLSETGEYFKTAAYALHTGDLQ
jgi:Leucine-rich repeat (LRR) protein